MENPMVESRSPSDFWGKRWNVLVHDLLKRGVFLPVRKHHSKYAAVMSTFVASGLFHEWMSMSMFPNWGYCSADIDDGDGMTPSECYGPPWGFSLMFFLWQAGLIALEFQIGHWKIFSCIPGPLQTPLLICSGAIVGHWFLIPYVDSNYFEHASLTFFLLKKRL